MPERESLVNKEMVTCILTIRQKKGHKVKLLSDIYKGIALGVGFIFIMFWVTFISFIGY